VPNSGTRVASGQRRGCWTEFEAGTHA